MDLNFWSIIKILFGIYCIVGTIRFFFFGVGIFLANLGRGITGCIVGGIAAILLKNYMHISTPPYIVIPIGILFGCIINNIMKEGFRKYMQTNVFVLWDAFKIAFWLKKDYDRTTSSSTSMSNNSNKFRRTYNKNSGTTCVYCTYWDNHAHRCNYHNESRSSTDSSCDYYKDKRY